MSLKTALPRRRLLAGALSFPAIATAAAAPALAAADPDAALLELGRQHEAVTALYNDVWDRADAALDAAIALYPPKPEALRVRPEDWTICQIPGSGLRTGEFLTGEHIMRCRDTPDMPWALSTKLREELRPRRDEILAAWDGWIAAKERANVAHGVRETEAEGDRLGTELTKLEYRIFETPAHTPAGWRLKARIALRVVGDEPDGTYESHVLLSLLRDLTA